MILCELDTRLFWTIVAFFSHLKGLQVNRSEPASMSEVEVLCAGKDCGHVYAGEWGCEDKGGVDDDGYSRGVRNGALTLIQALYISCRQSCKKIRI